MVTGLGSKDELTETELAAAAVRYPQPEQLHRRLEIKPPRAAKAAAGIGLRTVGDLIWHLPFRHDDRGDVEQVALLRPGEDATVAVEVRKIAKRQAYRRRKLTIVEATVADNSGTLKAIWFNQPWLVDRLKPGTRVVLHGRFEGKNRFRVSEYELTDISAGGGESADDSELRSTGLVPVYPATEGLASTRIRELVWSVRGHERNVVDPLPLTLRTEHKLPDLPSALSAIHWPQEPAEATEGRRRLAFDELLLAQLVVLRRREGRRQLDAPDLGTPGELVGRWLADSLPFTLTDDQQSAVKQIDEDLRQGHPMQRLLMGEVGSGKTVVALYTMLRALEHGMQAALMAPTETLAEQHFATIQQLMPGELVSAALLTGSTTSSVREDILGKVGSGELKLIVGTHALIEQSVEFDQLAIAVVDEQHRFGVAQRAALDHKGPDGSAVHVLHMTATPIPRTLALTAYGDLEATALRELPGGRKPISTYLASSERERARAYERIREELRAGRQAFVVCPLVEESELLQAKAATVEYQRLATTEFKEFSVVLMHGQMRSREKQEAMAQFAAGQADVLVATSVIEVGIDIPNATVMLVENAERYGISQLHQLRGRIGRGEHDSICLLFGPKGSARLKALAEHSDGFELAEIDLALRGEGEVAGTRQSGIQQFRVARLPQDLELLSEARNAAEVMLRTDPGLEAAEHTLLAAALEGAFGEETLEPIPA